ncbi:30S ribosomal protein S7 [Candidatus Nomurabacteria bacterium]|nr:30S ribosomal protein S7 [Candidatus Nomurabacteria bacterium]
MPRGKAIPKRIVKPDPVYGSELLAKFINYLMLSGKKTVAQEIVYGALDILKEKTGKEGVKGFDEVIDKVRPQVEVRSRRVGGANYQVPMPVSGERQNALAFRWIIAAARAKKGRSMKERLAQEFVEIIEGTAGSLKKKEDTLRMAEANRAFAHFARR